MPDLENAAVEAENEDISEEVEESEKEDSSIPEAAQEKSSQEEESADVAALPDLSEGSDSSEESIPGKIEEPHEKEHAEKEHAEVEKPEHAEEYVYGSLDKNPKYLYKPWDLNVTFDKNMNYSLLGR